MTSDVSAKIRDEIIKDTINLISFRTYKENNAEFDDELSKAFAYIKKIGERYGFIYKNYDNKVVTLSFGQGKRNVGVVLHLDVVPAVRSEWQHDPFIARVENNVIYGRGSNDNKGPAMALLHAAINVIHENDISNRLTLIFGSNEEGKMEDIDYYLANSIDVPEIGFVPDATFPVNYGEHGLLTLALKFTKPKMINEMQGGEHWHITCPSINAKIKCWNDDIFEKFDFFLKERQLDGNILTKDDTLNVTIKGKQAHGSRPNLAIDPFEAMMSFIGAYYGDKNCMAIAKMFKDWQGKEFEIAHKDMKYGELTLCVTKIETNADSIECIIDVRYPFCLDKLQIIKTLSNAWCQKAKCQQVEVLEDREGHYIAPDSKLVKDLEKIYRDISGDDITPCKVSPGDTYARKFNNFVTYGPTTVDHLKRKDIGQAHQANEGMDIDTLMIGYRIYYEALLKLLNESGE
ncbi:MAG: Sapep family Mn(2+)-dependent dipeptidase [Erysipelotrichaceae bacterium]|nr:Sapep family Mn(2+)-dependent dipeptidase [Erysipelotrichaceae bacterium]MDY5251622.1 Sapep family Mn(2+)-dependent dipeptidase [Erysipelotrichaceae bacterium]